MAENYLSLFLSRKELAGQYIVVKSSKAVEPEKLKEAGRISHKKACPTTTIKCILLPFGE